MENQYLKNKILVETGEKWNTQKSIKNSFRISVSRLNDMKKKLKIAVLFVVHFDLAT